MRNLGLVLLTAFIVGGCITRAPDMSAMEYRVIASGQYEIATWSRIMSPSAPIHIYIEGDGHAFDARGIPTADPTPRGTLVRDLASQDSSPNVAYIARPCQYIMSPACTPTDWTSGRFSPRIIDAMHNTVRDISGGRPIVLVGYSGGAMISGLIIQKYSDMDVEKWITIAGVLNHDDWTSYFDDTPLSESMNMTTLPRVPQVHYVASDDRVVPYELTRRVARGDTIIVVPDSTHTRFKDLVLDF